MSLNTEIQPISNSTIDKNQEKEIKEVIEIINETLLHLDKAISKISSASGWGVYDTLFGGGIISSMVKQDKMSDSNREIELANRCIKKLKNEIKDITVVDSIQVSNLLANMDVFFDNIFSDMKVQKKIAEAERNCKKARRQLVALRTELNERLEPKPISQIPAEKEIQKDREEDIKAAMEACSNALLSLKNSDRSLEKAISYLKESMITRSFAIGYLVTDSKVEKAKMKLRSSNRDLDTLHKKLKNVSIDTTNRSNYLKFIEISKEILDYNESTFDKEASKIYSEAKSSCVKSIKEVESFKDELERKISKE